MFKKLEGDTAMLRDRAGVYRVSDLYSWDGGLYARASGGYIRLRGDGSTSKDGVYLEHIEHEGELWSDRFGRLAVEGRDGYKPMKIEFDGGKTLLLPGE